jgi:hypothetical protein
LRRSTGRSSPARSEALRFERPFKQACHLAEARQKLVEHPELVRALEQKMLYAITQLMAASEGM